MIINADDFGMTHSTTAAIAESFDRGLCSSTTLMPNQPATEEAVELAHKRGLEQHIGLHLVLNAGRPLTDAIRRHSRFCDSEGNFCFSRARPTLRLSGDEKAALAAEVRAQIACCRREFRLPLTHMDSHINTHTEWGVGVVVIAVAREEKVPFVRLARNCGPGIGPLKRLYKHLFNRMIHRAGLARTRYIGSVDDCVHLLRRKRIEEVGPHLEVMTHPDYDTDGRLIDLPNRDLMEESLRRIPGYLNAESFSARRYAAAPEETVLAHADRTGKSPRVSPLY
jgi:chitin disaccharide deacetylase